jgi:hypothetical protein
MDDINLVLGIAGMLLLLIAFALNLLRIKTEDSRAYILLNIFGAGISTYYAVALNAIPFVILESVWGLFAIYKLIAILRK